MLDGQTTAKGPDIKAIVCSFCPFACSNDSYADRHALNDHLKCYSFICTQLLLVRQYMKECDGILVEAAKAVSDVDKAEDNDNQEPARVIPLRGIYLKLNFRRALSEESCMNIILTVTGITTC